MTIGRQSARQRNVLLVEDNPVNQCVAVRLLIRRGHRVTLANTGLAALAALEKDRFDIVLMDVQMPEMDGLEATARIREGERLTGEHMRIIAMTAHAMKGDRERYLESGMDAYLPKPIAQQDLFDMVESTAASERVVPGDLRAAPVLDVGQMRDRCGDDDELIAEIVSLFLEDYPLRLAAIEQAIEDRDLERIRIGAHTLKGGAANFSASRVVAAANALEAHGSPSDFSLIGANFAILVAEVEHLAAALREFQEGSA
jgi:two-component system, sensor histidine kinase and response regulator